MSDAKVDKRTPKGVRLGGRQKGTPNKTTEHIFDVCERMKFDPIINLVHIATNNWEALGYTSEHIERLGFGGQVAYEDRISIKDRSNASEKLVDYMYPKRKAIEVKTDATKDTTINLNYNPAALKESKDKNAK